MLLTVQNFHQLLFSFLCCSHITGNHKEFKPGFQDHLSLNAGQTYCRMLQGEHSVIRLTYIKLPIVNKIFVLSFFGWPFYTGFTVHQMAGSNVNNGI